MPRDLFDRETRNSAAYRADRLEEERHRLHRRLVWAMHRGDQRAIARLQKRLGALELELGADLAPRPATWPARHAPPPG